MALIPQAYDPEWTVLNDGVYNDGAGGGDGSTPPPGPPLPVAASPSPNGVVPWSNPCSAYGVPIVFTAGVTSSINSAPLLVKNKRRNLLLLQNLSTATVAGDIAPILYFSFGRPAVVGESQALFAGTNGAPGGSLVLDYIVPRDSLYVTFGPFTNTGSSVIIAGAVTEGVHAPEDENYQLPSFTGPTAQQRGTWVSPYANP